VMRASKEGADFGRASTLANFSGAKRSGRLMRRLRVELSVVEVSCFFIVSYIGK